MKNGRTHRLKYEVFRIVALGVLILCIVFAAMMVMELHMLTGMRATIDNSSIFSEYYEHVKECKSVLGKYVNTRQNEQRMQCIEAGKQLSGSNRELRETFEDPQFTDNYYLTESYLTYYNKIILPDEGSTDAALLDDYEVCERIFGYLLSNEEVLNSIRTRITFRDYHMQYALWMRQFLVLAAGIIVCSINLLIFSNARVRRLVQPIAKLTEQMQDFKNGAVPGETFPEGGILVTETEILENTFREMSEVIHAQMEELVEKMRLDQEVRALQLQNMQMQVDLNEANMKLIQSLLSPHFLFNCLNTVSGLAYFEQAPKTRQASQLIACYLRDSIRLIGQNISLEEEIRHTKEYMRIQELRFGGRITFAIRSDGMNGDVKVPSMLLQPLVENSISHGLKTVCEGGKIEVTVQTRRETVFLQVQDNGDGMEREALERIRMELGNYGTLEKMTGLYGVAARLATIYGDRASVNIDSIRGKGTCISITLEPEK